MDNRKTPITAAASTLYKRLIGSAPNAVVRIDADTVLVETGEAAGETRSLDLYPSGYREIIMDRRRGHWFVAPLYERGEISDALAIAIRMRAQARGMRTVHA